MGEDINVRSIKLLESYHNTFTGFSSAAQQKINSYLAVLENSANQANQLKSRIHSFAERRKAYLNKATAKMAAAFAEQPVNPNHIAVAIKRLEGCKDAYETSKKYDEKCDEMVKKIRILIEQAKQQSIKYRTDISQTAERGDSFLNNYISKLQSYSGHNG